MTDYRTTVERYGRKEVQIDLARFAQDLGAALGYAVAIKKDECDHTDRMAEIKISDDLGLHVFANGYNSKGKVHVEAVALGIPHDDRPYYGTKEAILPDAHVSPERPIAALAKDIKRRVIDPAADPLAYRKDYAAHRVAQRGSLAATVAAVSAAVPEMTYRDNGMSSSDNHRRQMFWQGGSIYLQAYVYSDGSVAIERMPSVTVEQFAEIAAIIRRGKKGG